MNLIEIKNNVKFLIAVPIYKEASYSFILSLINAFIYLTKEGWCFSYCLHKNSFLQISRDEIATKFVEDNAHTHLLFIDSDVIFTGEDIENLIISSFKHDGGITAGLYPVKENTPRYCLNYMSDPLVIDNLTEVRHAGTGFMLIKKEVFEEISKRTFKYRFSSEISPLFFNFFQPIFIPQTDMLVTDDFAFCERARECGKKVFVCNDIILGHVGEVDYLDVHKLKKIP